MLCSLIFALPILIDDESRAFEQVASIVCYAFALQGFIQFLAFLIPPLGDYLIAMKPEDLQNRIVDTSMNVSFRGYSLTGSPFFELPAGFGVAFILFFRIIFIEGQRSITKYWKYIVFFLLLWGAMLSGRTAFIGLLLALSMACVFARKSLFNYILKTLGIIAIILVFAMVIYSFLLPAKQKDRIENDVLPFAFEFYYNYKETGKWSTTSSDAFSDDNFYFMPSTKTFLVGDGRFSGSNGTYYGNSDAGYMRTLLYGGIFFILFLYTYQLLFFMGPFKGAIREGTTESQDDFICFLFLLAHLFILEYKGTTIGLQNIMQVLLLFIGSGYMIRHYFREENLETND